MSLVLSHAQYQYFVTFIDDYSRCTWVYFLRSKSDVFSPSKLLLPMSKPNFLPVLRSYTQILGENTCLMLYNIFYKRRVFSLSVRVLIPLNRMASPSVRMDIF